DLNAEDHDLILRLGDQAGFVQIVEPITLGWRRHSDSLTQKIQRTAEGTEFLIHRELSGAYPGGAVKARARRDIISRHSRAVALACLREGFWREAWKLYGVTVRWHLSLGRWKFLAGFPVRAALKRR